MKKTVLISFITLPLSVFVVYLLDVFMDLVMGGIATTKGFPIPYYRDVWLTPGIDYFIPSLKFIDIGIIYILFTFIGYKVIKK